jgi:hypothetical protein
MDLGQMRSSVTVTLSKEGYRKISIPVRRPMFEQTDDALLYQPEVTLTPLPAAAPEPLFKKRRPTRRGSRRPKRRASKPKAPAPTEPAPAPPAPAKPKEDIPDNPF